MMISIHRFSRWRRRGRRDRWWTSSLLFFRRFRRFWFLSGSSSKADSSKERSAIDEALDLIAPFTQAIAQAKKDALKKKNEKKTAAHDCQYYSFRNFSQASQLGSFLAPFYEGESSLYKDSVSNNYYMILRKAESQEDAFPPRLQYCRRLWCENLCILCNTSIFQRAFSDDTRRECHWNALWAGLRFHHIC